MSKETINIVLASDENYAQPLGVALYSALDNFSSDKYDIAITILDGGISDESKEKIEAIAKTYNKPLSFVRITNETFKDFPLMQHYSIAIYYRLIIPTLFPNEVEKVLYIDADTLVLGNISPLYETNIENYYLGAVKDFISDVHLKNATASFYKKISKMFNSGVLLLNLKKIRQDNFTEKTFQFIEQHSHELVFPDQDALNIVSGTTWLELDKIWNMQMDISQQKTIPEPKILHYTNSYKPWHKWYSNYYQDEYMHYLKKAWPYYTLKPVSNKIALKQLLKHIPWSVQLVRAVKKMLR